MNSPSKKSAHLHTNTSWTRQVEDGDDQAHSRPLKLSDQGEDRRHPETQSDASGDGQADPEGEEAFEDAHRVGLWCVYRVATSAMKAAMRAGSMQ